MVFRTGITRTSKILILFGSFLLLAMSGFHGSGFVYVSDAIHTSNAEPFVKKIVPTLFAHPSIHLFGLAVMGIATLYLKEGAAIVLYILALITLMDAVLAFAIGGWIPGVLLALPVLCFCFAAFIIRMKRAGQGP